MSSETIGKSAILGELKDSGVNQTMLNRLEDMLETFGGNIPQFVAATKGQLFAAYNKTHPGKKGIGRNTLDAFNRFCAVYRRSVSDAKTLAKETVAAEEAREAEKQSMRDELLSRKMDLKVLADTVAWYSAAFSEATLGEVVSAYERFSKRPR